VWQFEGPWRGIPGQFLSDQIRQQRGWQSFRSMSKEEKQQSLSTTTTMATTTTTTATTRTTAKTIFNQMKIKRIP